MKKMNMLRKDMEERDADLGYIKRYAEAIHKYLEQGGELSGHASFNVRQAHEYLQSALTDIPKEFWS